GATEVVIDDDDIAPANLSRPIGKTILAPLTLEIVDNLIRCRLTNVDDGLTGKVLRRDLAHERPPSSGCLPRASRCWRRRWPPPGGPGSGGRECPSATSEYPASCDPSRTGPVA